MNGLFNFDVKSLNDDELLDLWHSINRKILLSSRFGNEVVGQLMNIKAAIEFEQRERIVGKMMKNLTKASPVATESDPDLAAEHKAKIAAESEDKTKKTARPSILSKQRYTLSDKLTKTSTPINDVKQDDD